MNNEYEHAFQNQLFLCAYLHGKRVMPLACERVRTCRMRAFTLFLENQWRVTYNDRFLPEKRGDQSLMLFDILKNFNSKLVTKHGLRHLQLHTRIISLETKP